MVQFMISGDFRSVPEMITKTKNSPAVSVVEDSSEDEFGPFTKRSKHFHAFQDQNQNQLNLKIHGFLVPPSQYNPLAEPSPLGLRLRKSPSLLELIQMRLSQSNTSTAAFIPSENHSLDEKKEVKKSIGSIINDKIKASNFPASVLRIGSWEFVSRYEGDLVAKCYFAKHKLVWEILVAGLKSKIEIQWSDILDLKANCPDNGPSTLIVVLARQPRFFRESNPQPKKHTLWQATGDFTDGQASKHRKHFLQCPQGVLNKHFEKLIMCDMRLYGLTQQPEMILDSPYFELPYLLDEQNEPSRETSEASDFPDFHDVASPAQSSMRTDHGFVSSVSECMYQENSPISVMDVCGSETGTGTRTRSSCEPEMWKERRKWEHLKVSGPHPSISMVNLMSHVENCISEQIKSENQPHTQEQTEPQDPLEEIKQFLLSDSQLLSVSDEIPLMKRINSLCSLLEPGAVQNSCADVQKRPTLSRKDSFGELLHNLPRVASISELLFGISEDGERRSVTTSTPHFG